MTFGRLLCVLLASMAASLVVRVSAGQDAVSDDEPLLRFGAVYTGEIFGGLAGGLSRDAAYLHNVDLTATLSLDSGFRRRGPRIHAHLLGNHGTDPSEFLGDAQTVSNIAAHRGWTLFELNAEQSLFDHRVSLLIGLYDLNSEFDASGTAGFFINSSFGVGAEFGASGLNGPSIFPITSLGTRIRWCPAGRAYVQAAVLDGMPGHETDPRRTFIRLSPDEGALLAFETGLHSGATPFSHSERLDLITRRDDPDSATRVAAGVWHYTGSFVSIRDTSATLNGSTGLYALAETSIPLGMEGDLRCFARTGWADPRTNRFTGSVSGGCVFGGFTSTLPDATVGLAVTTALNGGAYLAMQRVVARPVSRAETAIELGVGTSVTSFMTVMADVQLILDPGTDPSVPNALAAGLRMQIGF